MFFFYTIFINPSIHLTLFFIKNQNKYFQKKNTAIYKKLIIDAKLEFISVLCLKLQYSPPPPVRRVRVRVLSSTSTRLFPLEKISPLPYGDGQGFGVSLTPPPWSHRMGEGGGCTAQLALTLYRTFILEKNIYNGQNYRITYKRQSVFIIPLCMYRRIRILKKTIVKTKNSPLYVLSYTLVLLSK